MIAREEALPGFKRMFGAPCRLVLYMRSNNARVQGMVTLMTAAHPVGAIGLEPRHGEPHVAETR